MSVFTTYDIETGRIKSNGDVDESLIDLQGNSTTGVVSEWVDGEKYYYPDGNKTLRPALSLIANKATSNADGLDEWIVTGVPVGALVTWPDGVVTTVDDGEIVFTVDVVGTYNFTVNAFPYLPLEVTVEAVT